MRRGVILTLIGAVVVIVGIVIAATNGGESTPTVARTTGLDAQTVSAGEVDITIEPRQLDGDGAVFAIALDTHSGDLTSDLAADARLEVGGVPWLVATWDGDGPGGHHRAGDLRFDAAGAATGTVRLTIDGFTEPVEVTWGLGP